MEAELESELGGGDCIGYKRVDPEEFYVGGDAKRTREGNSGLDRSFVEMDDDEDEDEEDCSPPENSLDHYPQCWMDSYGRSGISFEDESTNYFPSSFSVFPLPILGLYSY
jgi:hypothetical protein